MKIKCLNRKREKWIEEGTVEHTNDDNAFHEFKKR